MYQGKKGLCRLSEMSRVGKVRSSWRGQASGARQKSAGRYGWLCRLEFVGWAELKDWHGAPHHQVLMLHCR